MDKLCNVLCKTALMSKSVFCNAPHVYKKISIRHSDNNFTFKQKLKTLLLEKCYYTLNEFLTDKDLYILTVFNDFFSDFQNYFNNIILSCMINLYYHYYFNCSIVNSTHHCILSCVQTNKFSAL